MTHEQAVVEAERRQREQPDAKFLATQRGEDWVVARIALAPDAVTPTATATKPPPPPHEAPQSELQRVSTLYGTG